MWEQDILKVTAVKMAFYVVTSVPQYVVHQSPQHRVSLLNFIICGETSADQC